MTVLPYRDTGRAVLVFSGYKTVIICLNGVGTVAEESDLKAASVYAGPERDQRNTFKVVF
jgi:hypothetical protein